MISTSRSRRLSINRLILRAGQLAGVWDAEQPQTGAKWEQYSAMAKDFLQVIVDGIAAEGKIARFIDFHMLYLTAGTDEYQLPETIIGLTGDASYLPAGTTGDRVDGELIITQRDRQWYQRNSAKATQGVPNSYYEHRTADSFYVYLWPVPSEAGRIRFQAIVNPADTADGSATLDLQIEWYETVLNKLALEMGRSQQKPLAELSLTMARANQSLEQAKSVSGQRTGGRFRMAHRTPWSR